MILKKGSKGADVKKVQLLLGLNPDGDFGIKTEIAVKNWQKNNGLMADGIVGINTWNKMFPTSIINNSKCVDSSVIYNPLNIHITKFPNRKIEYLAIHFTAGSSSIKGKANTVKNVFESRKASADFCVDDEQMVQFNPDLKNYYCWAVGDKKDIYSNGGSLYGKANNKNTISIEVCSTLKKGTSVNAANHEGWSFTDKVLENAIKLSKILMKKYNIPLNRVVRHYDISGKLCPGLIGWNDSVIYDTSGKSTNKKNNSDKWMDFKNKLSK